MNFGWNPRNASLNVANHGVTFEEARLVFDDDHALIEPDEAHSFGERRFTIIGEGYKRLLFVVFTERRDDEGEELIWLISAREVEPYERERYYES